MLRECSFGITSAWPLVHGLMSMKASVLSSSSILCEGISPVTSLQKRQSGSVVMKLRRLQPVDPAEVAVQAAAQDEHQDERAGIADTPAQLGHVPEVHAVDARDQRRHCEDRGPRRNLAHLLVLPH